MSLPRLPPPSRVTAVYCLTAAVTFLIAGHAGVHWIDGDQYRWLWDSAFATLLIAGSAAGLYRFVDRRNRQQRKTWEAWQSSQRRWEFAVEESGDGLWDWDIRTGGVYYSPRWSRLLGYVAEEIEPKVSGTDELIHPDDRPGVRQIVDGHLAGKTERCECVFRMRARSGEYRWIRSRGKVVEHGSDGKPRRMIGTISDITDARLAEQRMGEELALKRAIFANTPIGMITLGPDGQAMTANAAAAGILGWSGEEVGRASFRSHPLWERAGLGEKVVRSLADGTERRLETSIETAPGRHAWLAVQLIPFAHLGERRLLVILQDVSARHDSMERLHLLHSALEAAPSGIAITDTSGVIEWVNPGFCRLTGYAAGEVIGRHTRILRSGRHAAAFYAQMWREILAGKVWSGEVQNRRKNGSLYTEQMTIAPVRNDRGEVSHFIAIKDDITERRSLEQQVARTQRLESVGLLASGLAHDLNNIFAPIMLSSELLRSLADVPRARKLVDLIETASQRGAGIVRQVLAFSRGMDGERVPVSPRYLLKELASMMRETLPRSIEVRLEMGASDLQVFGDSTQLHQVLLNLAINARDAMPDGGTLTLGLREIAVDESRCGLHKGLRPGRHVALTVADTGTGIAPEVMEHMFEPFFTTKPRGKGTGLGLSTVYGIIRSHRGAIEVETKLGEGTRFIVLLPAGATPERVDSTPPMAAPYEGLGRRLLIADDEESIRLLSMHILQRRGFVVELASDGAEALAFLREKRGAYAGLITDIMMPRTNGMSVIREARRIVPDLPVVAMSGAIDLNVDGDAQEGLSALGVTSVLYKPFTEAELLHAIRRELDGRTPEELASPAGKKKG
jgi:two-component system, cell cycle sensor histidine kinase and response regulator CckA